MILFAKSPIPGQVKTRLHPVLTPTQAAALHQTLVAQSLARLATLAPSYGLELHLAGSLDPWLHPEIPRRTQSSGDLGLRMLTALENALAAGHPQAMILGSDSPTLPLDYIHQLFAAPSDLALGPTEDGGYYAIAARRTHPAMFANVRWSTADTLADTLSAAHAAGLSTSLGPSWWDLDSPADLERLRRES